MVASANTLSATSREVQDLIKGRGVRGNEEVHCTRLNKAFTARPIAYLLTKTGDFPQVCAIPCF
jgi:hypothetical protein